MEPVTDLLFRREESVATITLNRPGKLMKESEIPAGGRMPPRCLGKHTDCVLRDLLGYEEERIAALHAEGTI